MNEAPSRREAPEEAAPVEDQAEPQAAVWSLYIVQTAQGHLYTGISTDVERRFKAHREGKGARALRGKGPLQLMWQHPVSSQRQALRLEYRIKQLPRYKKWALCQGQVRLSQLIEHWQLTEEKNFAKVSERSESP